jgi:hypothetical protein
MIELKYHPDDYSGWAKQVLGLAGPGGDGLDGLDATPWERAQLEEVLAELDEEEAMGIPPGQDEGPWHDDAAMAGLPDPAWLIDLSTPAGIELAEEAGTLVGDAYSAEAVRVVEDAEDWQSRATRRPSFETRVSRAMERIEGETFVPPPMLRGDGQPRDAHGAWMAACGPVDDLGYCQERFHAASCSSVAAGMAATGNATEAEAWRNTLTSHPTSAEVAAAARGARAAQLANPVAPQHRDWDDLMGSEPDPMLHDRMIALLEEGPPPREQPPMPPVGDLARQLGLRK